MAQLPIVILHGWSDSSASFKDLAQWLKQNGFNVVDIYLGDYLSMNDEITLFDLAAAFGRALKNHNIPQNRFSFDAIVHSTGGLVMREYLRQVCAGDPSKTPVKHLCMLSPANFGSPLARLANPCWAACSKDGIGIISVKPGKEF
jgi:triacylglycerol esterase/lipase EstA (alpha/beta hydrolase family)